MPLVHKHIIVRAEVTKPLNDVEITKVWMNELIQKINMKKLAGPLVEYCHTPGNTGITSVVIIETSHCAIHIWDECTPALVQLDVYTCSTLPIDKVLEHLQVMEPTKVEYKYLDREHELQILQ